MLDDTYVALLALANAILAAIFFWRPPKDDGRRNLLETPREATAGVPVPQTTSREVRERPRRFLTPLRGFFGGLSIMAMGMTYIFLPTGTIVQGSGGGGGGGGGGSSASGTLFVWDLTGDSLGVAGETFSGTSHDSTHIQVNEVSDGNWTTTPIWNVKLGPVTTDTVTTTGDSAVAVMARYRYKDNGTWQSWDSIGIATLGFGPEGGPNEPAGMTRMTGRAYNTVSTNTDKDPGNGSLPWMWSESEGWDPDQEASGGSSTLSADAITSGPLSPGKVLAFRYPAGAKTPGVTFSPGNSQTRFFGTNGGAGSPVQADELYVRYAFYATAGAETNDNSGTWKHTFFQARDPDGGLSNGPVLVVDDDGADFHFQWNLQTTEEAGAGNRTWEQTTAYTWSRETWYDLEVYMKLNSALGTKDGIIRTWIKEMPSGTRTLIFEQDTLRLRTDEDTDADSYWDILSINPLWGGDGGTVDTEFYLYIDHVWISVK